jgi:hypothetical protein
MEICYENQQNQHKGVCAAHMFSLERGLLDQISPQLRDQQSAISTTQQRNLSFSIALTGLSNVPMPHYPHSDQLILPLCGSTKIKSPKKMNQPYDRQHLFGIALLPPTEIKVGR